MTNRRAHPTIPPAPRAIRKGVPLAELLGAEAIDCLARNIRLGHRGFDAGAFRTSASAGLAGLGLMARADHIATALARHLPSGYARAIGVLLDSLTPERIEADEFGLAEFFYLPHGNFIATNGLDPARNDGVDPFETSMDALHALTTRFTSEFAIRPFLIAQPERTLAQVRRWTEDPNPHVRRLCSEGTRPRLPWGKRIQAFIADPTPTLPILERLATDPSLYVRRSVANHLGDIAKDHPRLVLETGRRWLARSDSAEMKWLVRHAIRYLVKRKDAAALELRGVAR